jgi:hypothetical protein
LKQFRRKEILITSQRNITDVGIAAILASVKCCEQRITSRTCIPEQALQCTHCGGSDMLYNAITASLQGLPHCDSLLLT